MAGTRSIAKAPDRTGGSPAPVVVGIDGSSGSKAALQWAATYAAATCAPLHAVIAWHVPLGVGWALPLSEQGLPARHARILLESTLDEVLGSERPPGFRASVVEGHPVAALLTSASQARVLVVGSRGHGGFGAMMLGSVSSSCTQHAACPVVVVR